MRKRIIATAITALLVASFGYADVAQPAPGRITVSVEPDASAFAKAQKASSQQSQSAMCWAACVQMVLKFHGLEVGQSQVAQRIFGGWNKAQGARQQIIEGLNGWEPDRRGSFSTVWALHYEFQGIHLAQEVEANRPLIVELKSPNEGTHAFVLTSVSLRLGYFDQPIFEKVVLRDPWPGHADRQELSWDEFKQRLNFIVLLEVWPNVNIRSAAQETLVDIMPIRPAVAADDLLEPAAKKSNGGWRMAMSSPIWAPHR